MKRFLQLGLVLFLSLAAAALENGHVRYLGGTEPGVTAGVVGQLDTTSETLLIFEHAGNKLSIPYASIESYEYSKDVSRHLGVLPAIAIGLLKMRQRRHFFYLSYHVASETAPQVAVFEVPKDFPPTLEAILQARAPGACKPHR
jgi:hypothetical protein